MTSLGKLLSCEPAFDFASKNLSGGHYIHQRHRDSNVNYDKTVRILSLVYITSSYTVKSHYPVYSILI